MIIFYLLSDAIPATLFGMFALWAASSRRHWFVRLAVVSAALLIVLLIPAYEVVVEFGIGMLLTVIGIGVWRWRRQNREQSPSAETAQPTRFRPQVSLETLMLLMVVVAVTTAVAAQAPHLAAVDWETLVGVGVVIALIGLVSVWFICGRARWWVRLGVAGPLVVLLGVGVRLLWVGRDLLYLWLNSPARIPSYWQDVGREGIWESSDYWRKTVAISVFILCAWLFLMRKAGWFDPFHETDGQIDRPQVFTRSTTIARWIAVMLFVLTLLFPLVLFYRLMTPAPIPDLSAPSPNGYDELVAAGRMIGETDGTNLRQLIGLSDAKLRTLVAKNKEACERAHRALQGECRFPLLGVEDNITVEELRALYGLRDALYCRMKLAANGGTVREKLAAHLDLLRLSLFEERSNGANQFTVISPYAGAAMLGLSQFRNAMTADECIQLIDELWRLDAEREPWASRIENQRVIEENSGWEAHLHSILSEWSGQNWYGRGQRADMLERIETRMLIVNLAIRAFQLRNGRLPNELNELTPDFLPAVPEDPYDDGRPLKYCVTGDTYLLYSVGQNKVNDGDGTLPNRQGQEGDDLVDADLFPVLAGQPANQPAANAAGEDASEGPAAAAPAKPE